MDLKKIKAFVELAKEEGVQELKYESDKVTISVKLPTTEHIVAREFSPMSQREVTTASPSTEKVQHNFHEVKSPFVGTFYSASAPGKPTFVQVGDRVQKGQTLCILEAMKIMNEIDSDINGEIVEICVENESFVEFGQTLFLIKPN